MSHKNNWGTTCAKVHVNASTNGVYLLQRRPEAKNCGDKIEADVPRTLALSALFVFQKAISTRCPDAQANGDPRRIACHYDHKCNKSLQKILQKYNTSSSELLLWITATSLCVFFLIGFKLFSDVIQELLTCTNKTHNITPTYRHEGFPFRYGQFSNSISLLFTVHNLFLSLQFD